MNGYALAVLAALLLIPTAPALAQLNSKQRVNAFAKLPDWSGLWEQFTLGAGPAGAEERKRWEEARAGSRPPYNPEWEARYQASVQSLVSDSAHSPEQPTCTFGFPTLMAGSPLMFQAIVLPEETTLIFSQRETRHIYTDGRGHPPADEQWATPWGNSIGHWEGQTLVVDTIAVGSLGLLTFIKGYNVWLPLSPAAHFVEHIRRLDSKTLEDQVDFEDPVATTKPWRYTFKYHRVPNMNALIDEDCRGNDRNPVVNGRFTLSAP